MASCTAAAWRRPGLHIPAPQRPHAARARAQNYVRNLVDFQNSVVGHLERFDAIAAHLAAGDNVVMLANHQTEADPGARRRPGRSVPWPEMPTRSLGAARAKGGAARAQRCGRCCWRARTRAWRRT